MRTVRFSSLIFGALLIALAGSCYDTDSGDSLATARQLHTATLLESGQVLVAGGEDGDGNPLDSTELYDPDTNTWIATGSLAQAREEHTATLLSSGKVLVAGGEGPSPLASAELFDPATRQWTATGSMAEARAGHTATRLPSGQVLVTGGLGASGPLASAELYDPDTGTWSAVAPMAHARVDHTATLLPSGTVLVVGGTNTQGEVAQVEAYDPTTGQWSDAGTLLTARTYHTASLLPDGRVLVAGGEAGEALLASTELYDPADPTAGWVAGPILNEARSHHSATLLPDGNVALVGGIGEQGNADIEVVASDATSSSVPSDVMGEAMVANHTATLLPSGRVLVVGGHTDASVVDTTQALWLEIGAWAPAPSMSVARASHTATLLTNGQVLVAGGALVDPATMSPILDGGVTASTELFDPATGTWSDAGTLATPRFDHTSTLLSGGEVLVTGGYTNGGGTLASVEKYDPASRAWTGLQPLTLARGLHTATRLHSGRVLVVGGMDEQGNLLDSVQLYDPAQDTWTDAAPLPEPRAAHAATLLPSGQVLVVGGQGISGTLASAERYNPTTNRWQPAGSMAEAIWAPTSLLLPNGKVLVSAGSGSFGPASLEIYDPATNVWQLLALEPSLPPELALLPTGDALFADPIGLPVPSVVFDPGLSTTDEFGGTIPIQSSVASAEVAPGGNAPGTPALRSLQTATRLPSGAVLVAGGVMGFPQATGSTGAAKLYVEGASDAWRPTLDDPAPLLSGREVQVTGSRLEGISRGSSGRTNASPGGVPRFTLLSLLTGQVRAVPVAAYTDSSATLEIPAAPSGPYILSVTVNGICNGRVVTVVGNGAPVADDQALSAEAGAPLAIQLTATDPQGDPLSYQVIAAPAHGTLEGTAPNLTYTADPAYTGPDRFTFQAWDGTTASNVATITLEVTGEGPRPSPLGRELYTVAGTPIPVTLAAANPGGDALAFEVVEAPSHGTLSGTAPDLTYTPRAGFTGTDRLTFRVTAGSYVSGVATVSITVRAAEVPKTPPSPYVASGCTSAGGAGGTGLVLLALGVLLGRVIRRRHLA